MMERLTCEACGHEHSGMEFAGICIGCPCPHVGGKITQAFMSKIPVARLPTTRELSGAYPDITDGMSTEEYINSIRGEDH